MCIRDSFSPPRFGAWVALLVHAGETHTAKGAFSLMTTLSVSPLAQTVGEAPPDNFIFGHSESMQAVRSRLGKVAAANVPVLITGESGTGKDIIARLIHGLSPWKV